MQGSSKKGNHVFNNHLMTIEAMYKQVLIEWLAPDLNNLPGQWYTEENRTLKVENEALKKHTACSLPVLEQIKFDTKWAEREVYQDDKNVNGTDENSRTYGVAKENFIKSIKNIKNLRERGVMPGEINHTTANAWEALINAGYDKTAYDNINNTETKHNSESYKKWLYDKMKQKVMELVMKMYEDKLAYDANKK